MGESERKNQSQIANNAVDVSDQSFRHFVAVRAPGNEPEINERRLGVMNQTRQTKIRDEFSLIVDDSGHRKIGNFTSGVGRQYIREMAKVDNGILLVTTHLYDGVKSLPLDMELYEYTQSLAGGKKNPSFRKKPQIALSLIERTLKRGNRPGIVLIDAGYGNNASFLEGTEKLNLKYLGGIAKNRKLSIVAQGNNQPPSTVDELFQKPAPKSFQKSPT